MSRKKGFTLIELLVVIAIIALLLSIILPSLRKAKGMAKKIVCTSGMHQLGLAMIAYTDDHDAKFPAVDRVSSGGWLFDVPYIAGDAIIDYAGQEVMFCPSNRRGDDLMEDFYAIFLRYADASDRPDPQLANSGWGLTDYFWMLSWGYRQAISDENPYYGDDIFIVKSTDRNQSQKKMVSDLVWNRTGNEDFTDIQSPATYPDTGEPIGSLRSNHVDGIKPLGSNGLYLDGHSEWSPFKELKHHYTAGSTLQHWW